MNEASRLVKSNAARILYWDIDGCVLNYSPENVKPALAGGRLQRLLRDKSFGHLVCVSGWTSLAIDPPFPWRALSDSEQKESIRALVEEAFPDRDLFHRVVELASNNDHRGNHIDLNADWYYVDDWAHEFFVKAHGEGLCRQFEGNRLLTCDPYADGTDIIKWLMRIPDRK